MNGLRARLVGSAAERAAVWGGVAGITAWLLAPALVAGFPGDPVGGGIGPTTLVAGVVIAASLAAAAHATGGGGLAGGWLLVFGPVAGVLVGVPVPALNNLLLALSDTAAPAVAATAAALAVAAVVAVGAAAVAFAAGRVVAALLRAAGASGLG